MRVLHVDTERGLRGGQTQLLHLARGRPQDAVLLPVNALLRPSLLQAGVTTFTWSPQGRWWGRRALRQVVRSFSPDLIAVHTAHAHALVRRLEAPVVVHRRVDFVPSRWAARRYRRAAGVIAVSHGVEEILRAQGVPRVEVVHDGVDTTWFTPGPSSLSELREELHLPLHSQLVLAVGALVPHKGHEVLVEALPWLPPEVHVLIAGQGPLRGALRRHADGLGVGERLHLLGQRRDVRRLLRSAHVLAHPSVEEGLGQVTLEAQACACPVVASRVGGLPESAGWSGRLVPPRQPEALARALTQALNEGRHHDLKLRRAELEARWSTQRMVTATSAAYCRFVNPKSRAGRGTMR